MSMSLSALSCPADSNVSHICQCLRQRSEICVFCCFFYPVSHHFYPPLLRLTPRKPLWLDLQPADIKSRWKHNWKSAQVVSSQLVCDPTIRQPGFDLPRQQWSLPNRFCTEQGHCGACRRKWRLTDTDLCTCGETQTMSHIVKSCPLTKLNSSLSRLRCFVADQLWFVTRIREEEDLVSTAVSFEALTRVI